MTNLRMERASEFLERMAKEPLPVSGHLWRSVEVLELEINALADLIGRLQARIDALEADDG